MERILITGVAGFIGFHLALRLLGEGRRVVGVDNLNDYYDVGLKQARLALLQDHAGFRFHHLDLANREGMAALFREEPVHGVVNLAAQAGVRYSLINPHAYVDANVVGFVNLLEGCREHGVKHLLFASSSSVYGANTVMPFSVTDNVDHPVSLYAATKKSNELLAHVYAHLYQLPVTGLRFFTVYGPWGRPDMAYFSFTKAMLAGRPIDVFNQGRMRRDFTYIDDVVEGVARLLGHLPAPMTQEGISSHAPYRIHNIGNHQPVELSRFIAILEELLGRKAVMNLLPMQPGDVEATYADIDSLTQAVGFAPVTPLEEGLARFVDWYRDYYEVRE